MITIIKQKKFQFELEENDILLTNNLNHPFVQTMNNVLNHFLEEKTKEDFTVIHTLGKIKAKKVYVINMDALTSEDKRNDLYKKIAEIKSNVCLLLDTFATTESDTIIESLFEAIVTKNYYFEQYKSKKESTAKNFYFYSEADYDSQVSKGTIYGEAMNHAKDLTNAPNNHLNALSLAKDALLLEKYSNILVKIIEKPEIEKMNMGLFLGVNKGSLDEPKLIFIKYQGLGSFENPVALVGKGVMYDTGGYSLKTPQSMPGMKGDMAGAAAVIGAIEAIAKLKLKVNVMGIIAATDNRIGENAIVPDDILTSAKGLTVEIISTDAEGRLTLADALWFAQKEGAKEIIDVATLTGSIVAALGDEFTGAFTNNRKLYKELKAASLKSFEPLWEMPITKGYHKELKSDVADLRNSGTTRNGGSCVAAAFLEEFIEKGTSWIHLDIAATSSTKNQATGVMVKTFTEFFIQRNI
ncbi:MAG: leucyl aminopeptidase family protein [Firmicutes bacterium]|nr:leucyl aminopeptidase family protein [Bacillota bacterium]